MYSYNTPVINNNMKFKHFKYFLGFYIKNAFVYRV